ncbi:MAG: PLD nuclease N-terminal domain-containing protein [Candidatus Pacebacteria bacterium]|nr:PLD nuclease N-terminal domain-containing protein [Candidatus Paceibacterota bacterium]
MVKKAIFIFSVFSATLLLFGFSFCVFAQELSDVDNNQISQNITNFIFALQRNDIAEAQSFFDTTNYKLLAEVKEALNEIKIYSYDLSEQNISGIGQGQAKARGKVIARGEVLGGNWQVNGWPVYFVFNKIGEKWLITDTDFHKSVGLGDTGSIMKTILPFFIIFVVAVVLLQVFWLWMLVNCFGRDFDEKNKWLVVLFFTNFIGAFFYYFLIKRRKVQQSFSNTIPEQAQIGNDQQISPPTTQKNKSPYFFLKVFLVCALIFAVIFVITIYFIFHQAFNTMSGFQNFVDTFSQQGQNLPKPQQVEVVESLDLQDSANNDFSGQIYRNDVYGFEIKYPEQWSLKDTLPKIKRDTIMPENVEFFNNPFPTSITRFVFYPNPMAFGTGFCNINYKVNSEGFKILSVNKEEDFCAPEYRNSHPSAIDTCSDGTRYACFIIEERDSYNYYFGYLKFDVTGEHTISEADADALLKKILFSFRMF